MFATTSELVSWLYLDMNSYFASVEQERNPELRGKPVAVVPLLADTTCCIAVSYEAKAFGVKTGTKVGEAKRLCPKIRLIEGNHEHYIRYHHQIVETVESCLPVDSVCSIDELACRLTGSQRNVQTAAALAMKIKEEIRKKVGSSLRCSIGVAPNRYLAKIAADMKKPDGFSVIRSCDLPQILYSLSPRDLPGVGPQMEARLAGYDIRTMERLCSLSVNELENAWGNVCGQEIWRLLRGEDLLIEESERKTISQSHVLPPEFRHEAGALQVLKKLVTKAALRLRNENLWASSIQIFVKYLGADTWKARCGLVETQDTIAFLHAIENIWKEAPAGAFYAVGVVLSGLVPDALHAPSLFDDPRREKLTRTLDELNEKFGKEAVHFGATHESAGLAPLRIAFTRIPDEDEG